MDGKQGSEATVTLSSNSSDLERVSRPHPDKNGMDLMCGKRFHSTHHCAKCRIWMLGPRHPENLEPCLVHYRYPRTKH